MHLTPDGLLVGSSSGPISAALLKKVSGVVLDRELVGLSARRLPDGRWCVSDGCSQRAPTEAELGALDRLFGSLAEAAEAIGTASRIEQAPSSEPTQHEVLLRALVDKVGAPTKGELDAARSALVAEASARTAPSVELPEPAEAKA